MRDIPLDTSLWPPSFIKLTANQQLLDALKRSHLNETGNKIIIRKNKEKSALGKLFTCWKVNVKDLLAKLYSQ